MAAKKIELNDELIIQQYKEGLPSSRIAELNYVSKRTVYRILNEHDVIRKPKISKESLIHCYCTKKMSILNISKKYKTSRYSIRVALKKYQIKKIQSEENNERTKKQ
jgi:DNA invertase Pin-like site-specific DNA recombinase